MRFGDAVVLRESVVTRNRRIALGSICALRISLATDWADIILASRDMMQVLFILHELFQSDADGPRLADWSVLAITTYCRPFKKNSRGRIVGMSWTRQFDAAGLTLHAKAIDIRDKDLAHTDGYPGRVHITFQGAMAERSPDKPLQFSPRTSMRIFNRDEFQALAQLVANVRAAIHADNERLGQLVLRARHGTGFTNEFVLGEIADAQQG